MKEYLPGARQGIGTRPDIKKKKKENGWQSEKRDKSAIIKRKPKRRSQTIHV